MSQQPPDPSQDPVSGPNHTPPETTDPAGMDLDEVLRPHTSRRQRAVQVGGVLAILLVVVWALLRGVAPSLLGGASVAPSVTPNPATVVITSNVSFGVVTVNGRKLAGSFPLVTDAFHEGTNLVTLAAPPFHPHSCSLRLSTTGQVGAVTGCRVVTGTDFALNGVSVTAAVAVEFDLDSTDLPPNLAASAYDTAAQALAAVLLHTVIPSGQYYATGMDSQGRIIARRAATPLQADVLIGPPDPQNRPDAQIRIPTGPFSCVAHMLCAAPGPGYALPASQRIWSVYTSLTLSWRYRSPSGAVIVSPDLPFNTTVQLVLTSDTSSGGWSVVSQPSSPLASNDATSPWAPTPSEEVPSGLCDTGANLVAALTQSQSQTTYETDVPQNQGVAGCEILVLATDGTTIQGTFLWRFGVLLAVDKGAHTLAPWLPLAPHAEIAAVGG